MATTIRVDNDTQELLDVLKKPGESYDDVVLRLIDDQRGIDRLQEIIDELDEIRGSVQAAN